jgi:aspartate racemase
MLLGPHTHPEISMHSAPLIEYVRRLEMGDVIGVGELMLASARRLAGMGADFLICPDNTIHLAFEHVEPRTPRPWLHIAEVVAEEAAARGFRRVGLIGTRWLVGSDVYPAKLTSRGLLCVRPSDAERDEVSRIIMDELVNSVFKPESVDSCLGVIGRMRDMGCDSVVLGCTELPLIINESNSPLPPLDSTRLLTRAALRRAIPLLSRERVP